MSWHEVRTTGARSPSTIGVMEDAPHISVAGDPKYSADIPERSAAEVDRAVAALAGKQHGIVARWQLLELGLTETMIKTRLRHSALHRLHRGVFVCGHRSTTTESRWMAAVLAFGPAAVLSHRSAGQLWGLVPRSSIIPEVTRPGRAGGRPRLVAHEGTLMADEVVRVRGIPVTSVPRTMFDLAGMLREREVERAWNEMEVREYRDRLSVPDLVQRYPGRKGTVLLTRLADRKTVPLGITRNDLEEAFLALVDRFRLPRPRMNAHLAIRDRFYEIDCLWEDRRVAIELDGGAAHGTAQAFQKDRERDRILAAERYTTARITWRQITETPAEVAADLALILTPYPLSDGSGAIRPLPPR
jgi:very-short-patch-repair endonuclease